MLHIRKENVEGKGRELSFQEIPKVTNPAFASSASAEASFNSEGGVGDHVQRGALFSPGVRRASTNSWNKFCIISA